MICYLTMLLVFQSLILIINLPGCDRSQIGCSTIAGKKLLLQSCPLKETVKDRKNLICYRLLSSRTGVVISYRSELNTNITQNTGRARLGNLAIVSVILDNGLRILLLRYFTFKTKKKDQTNVLEDLHGVFQHLRCSNQTIALICWLVS